VKVFISAWHTEEDIFHQNHENTKETLLILFIGVFGNVNSWFTVIGMTAF
jgi:hypothetical protein